MKTGRYDVGVGLLVMAGFMLYGFNFGAGFVCATQNPERRVRRTRCSCSRCSASCCFTWVA